MDKIQEVLINAGRKDLAQEYYQKVAGVGYELYAKGLDRVSSQCKTISENAKKLAKLIRENATNRKKKKSLKDLKKWVDILNKEMQGITDDINNLEGYKD